MNLTFFLTKFCDFKYAGIVINLTFEQKTMEKKDFYRQENECKLLFNELGTCYHLCTHENCTVLFHNDDELKSAMNVVALVSALFPEINILTFEIMSNHFHFAICGDKGHIMEWFKRLVSFLKSNPDLEESRGAISSLQANVHQIEDLENIRNVISYINRNGFIVNYNYTPFSYPWGANRFYFNDEAKLRYELLKNIPTFRCKRKLFHSNIADSMMNFKILDGYVSPLCYCRTDIGEKLFRNAQHYFSKLSRSVESSVTIAKEIGESFYYLDSELYSIVSMKCSKEYGCKTPSLLPAQAKVVMAKTLRYDYNASLKQISRLLKMDIATIQGMFPEV